MKWRRKKSSGKKTKNEYATLGKKGKRSKLGIVKMNTNESWAKKIYPVLLDDTTSLSDHSGDENIDRYCREDESINRYCLADQTSESTSDDQTESSQFDRQSKTCPENDVVQKDQAMSNLQGQGGILNQYDLKRNFYREMSSRTIQKIDRQSETCPENNVVQNDQAMSDLQGQGGILNHNDSNTNSYTVISSQTIQTSHLLSQKIKQKSKFMDDNLIIDDECSFMFEALQRIMWPSCDERALAGVGPMKEIHMNEVLQMSSKKEDTNLNKLVENSVQTFTNEIIIKRTQQILDESKRSVTEFGNFLENCASSYESDSTNDESTKYSDDNDDEHFY